MVAEAAMAPTRLDCPPPGKGDAVKVALVAFVFGLSVACASGADGQGTEELQTQVSDLETQVSALESQVSDLESSIATTDENVSALDAGLVDLTQRVNGLER